MLVLVLNTAARQTLSNSSTQLEPPPVLGVAAPGVKTDADVVAAALLRWPDVLAAAWLALAVSSKGPARQAQLYVCHGHGAHLICFVLCVHALAKGCAHRQYELYSQLHMLVHPTSSAMNTGNMQFAHCGDHLPCARSGMRHAWSSARLLRSNSFICCRPSSCNRYNSRSHIEHSCPVLGKLWQLRHYVDCNLSCNLPFNVSTLLHVLLRGFGCMLEVQA